eukprot:m.103610 g.103610  ORF g.103610 m.103610 type:complete len:217 (-) comp12581_c0_seq4:215-865(-)
MSELKGLMHCTRFLQTCGRRLELPDEVITTTAVCYTRISDTVLVSEVEPVLLGITLLYLVAKSSDHPRDLRDCISVATALADPVAVAPIAVDDRYRDVRESVVSTEQLVLRALDFDVGAGLPLRRLLLLFLLSFERDVNTVAGKEGRPPCAPTTFARMARTCTAILNDAVTFGPYVGLLAPTLQDAPSLVRVLDTLLSVYERPDICHEELRRVSET